MSRRSLILSFLLVTLAARGEEPPSPKVLERYKQMLEKNPGEGTALERLWKAYLDQGQITQLLAEYQAGGTFTAELVLGHLLKKAARHDEALAAFDRAAKLDELNPLAPLAAARLHSEMGQPRAAAEAYEKAAALLPTEDARLAETLLQLGFAWLAAGDAHRASEAWERTVALHPGDLDLHRRLADNYAQNRLTELAIGQQRRKLRADDYFTEMALGRILKTVGDRAAAFEVLADASFAAENPAEALPELIREAEELRKLDDAVQLQERYLRVVPQARPDGFQKLAELQEKNFEIEGAARTWDRLLRRAPSERDYLSVALEQHLERSAGRVDPGLLEKLYPPGAHVRLWQTAILFAGRQRFREAAQLGRRFFDRATTQRAVCGQELARWYLLAGEAEQARTVLRETIKLPADSLAAPGLRCAARLLSAAARG